MMIMVIIMNIMMIFMIIEMLNWMFEWLKIFFFCIYKMYLISAEGYRNANAHFLKIRKTDENWVSIKDSESGLGVKNTYD